MIDTTHVTDPRTGRPRSLEAYQGAVRRCPVCTLGPSGPAREALLDNLAAQLALYDALDNLDRLNPEPKLHHLVAVEDVARLVGSE